MPPIDRNSPEPFYRQVCSRIISAIESGRYPVGKRLPSIRECAQELEVSSSTIELAYRQLVAEGYVEARRGSGHVVCRGKSAQPASVARSPEYLARLRELQEAGARQDEGARFDFNYDAIDPEVFPVVAWARICREVFFSKGSEQACLYDEAQGLAELRSQIALHVSAEHGFEWTADQVLIMPTTRDLVSGILSLFDPAETVIAMEEPGYDEVARAIAASGFKSQLLCAYPTLDDVEAQLEGANVLFATPASQFPSNVPMSLETRRKLVDWAQSTGAYLIDDEYGWEMLSDVARPQSLAALDGSGRVIMTGTFSNTFSPAVCLSYALLPPELMLKWRAMFGDAHPRTPWQTQAAMAAFMESGQWASHIRKLRTALQRKGSALLAAIERYMGDAVDVVSSPSSQFVLVSTRDVRGEAELIEAAAAHGVRVYPTSRYWQRETPGGWRYVLVGFAGISLADIPDGVRTLALAWGLR